MTSYAGLSVVSAMVLAVSSHALAQGGSTSCGECCRGTPRVTNFGAPATVGTDWAFLDSEFVVHVFDVSACAAQLPGGWNAPRYEHPDWTRGKLGTVFGVTLDSAGNIYVAQSSVYKDYWTGSGLPADSLGTLGGGIPGAIFKLDSSTGAASVLCHLPNSDVCAPGPTCAPGLGNLTYSCEHDCIYVSNFEDGRIYRVSMSGVLLEAYDFGDQAIEAATPDTADTPGAAAYGRLTWAVAVNGDRLYFSVVNEDYDTYTPAGANQIWSIPLTPGTGAFAGAVSTLEITMPDCNGPDCLGFSNPSDMSNPVSDITFDGDCCMYVAERTMIDPSTSTAHSSRLMKFCREPGASWTWSGQVFHTGQTTAAGCTPAPNSCAGGVGIDPTCNLVWSTSDYMTAPNGCPSVGAPYYYGMSGLPTTGGNAINALAIDMNGDILHYDKTEVGSLEVACQTSRPCLEITNQKILCDPEAAGTGAIGCYTWTFSLTNNSQFSAKYVWIPLHPTPTSPITLNPNFINLLAQDGSLLDPGETTRISVQICGGHPGDSFCIQLGLETADFQDCCFEDVTETCLTLPECDCGQLRDQSISSVYCSSNDGATTVSFTYCFTLDNLSSHAMDQVIFLPFDTRQGYFVKDFWFLPPLLPGESTQLCVQVMNAIPGSQFCFHSVLMHPGQDCCCEFSKCITVPQCPANASPCDFNGDHVVDGQDLGILLGAWGPCRGCPQDVNQDGVVDGEDLGLLLGWWTS